MNTAKSIIIFFIVISILIFAAAHGSAWIKDKGVSSLSALISILKFDIPVPK